MRPTESGGSRFTAIRYGIDHGAMGARDQRREMARVKKRYERAVREGIAWQAREEAKRAARAAKAARLAKSTTEGKK